MYALTHVIRILRQSAIAPPPSRATPLVSLPPPATRAHHHRSQVSPTYLVTSSSNTLFRFRSNRSVIWCW
ncbi:hypothetical protein Hanom_Chr12g01135761 [Helianthus anomalus]